MLTTGLASDGQEKLELGRELIFGVESVGEVDSSDTAVGVDLNSKAGKKLKSDIQMQEKLQKSCWAIFLLVFRLT